MTDLIPQWGRIDEASRLAAAYHYAGKLPAAASIRACLTWHLPGGLFDMGGPAIAAVVFNIPSAQWKEEVWELGRLIRWNGECPPLTKLISQALKIVAKDIDLIISYADWTQTHHGGIYQAASWQYNGKRKACEIGVVINGIPIHGRNANHRFGTRSRSKLAARGIEAEPLMDEGKHLYWRALSKSGEAKAARLGLGCLPYPKPSKGLAGVGDDFVAAGGNYEDAVSLGQLAL